MTLYVKAPLSEHGALVEDAKDAAELWIARAHATEFLYGDAPQPPRPRQKKSGLISVGEPNMFAQARFSLKANSCGASPRLDCPRADEWQVPGYRSIRTLAELRGVRT